MSSFFVVLSHSCNTSDIVTRCMETHSIPQCWYTITIKTGEDRSALRHIQMQSAVFSTSEKAHGSFYSGEKQKQQY